MCHVCGVYIVCSVCGVCGVRGVRGARVARAWRALTDALHCLGLFTQEVGTSSAEKDGRLGASLLEHVLWTIWSNDVVYHKAMHVYDPRATGTLEPTKFLAALDAMNETLGHPLQHSQLEELTNRLPTTAEAHIDYEAFLKAFQVHDTHFGASAAPAPSDPLVEA